MWRTNGAGELYTYLPPDYSENDAVCDIPPYSTCNSVYGASVGRGSFTWKTGGRTTIAQRVRLNDAGQANGELELFANGKSLFTVGGLVLRDSSAGRIRGMQMQTFFGGESVSAPGESPRGPRRLGAEAAPVTARQLRGVCRAAAARGTVAHDAPLMSTRAVHVGIRRSTLCAVATPRNEC